MVIFQSLNHSGRRPDRSPCTAYGRLLHVVNLLAKNLESLDQAGAEHNSQTNMWKWGLVTFVSNPCLFTIEQCSKQHKDPTHVQLNSDRTERRQSISCRHHHANAGRLACLADSALPSNADPLVTDSILPVIWLDLSAIKATRRAVLLRSLLDFFEGMNLEFCTKIINLRLGWKLESQFTRCTVF